MRMHRSKAFTLIEVMVVVVIIGVLASVSILGYNSIQKNARDSSRFSKATIIAEALERYYEQNNEYPSVASLANQPVDTVKQKLSIQDGDVLVFPTGSPTTTSIGTGTPTTSKLVYIGSTQSQNAAVISQCQTSTNGYCDGFTLQYVKESDNAVQEITSRQTPTAVPECSLSQCLSAPTKPTVVGAAVGTTAVRFTAGGSSCAAGSLQYKIRYNTTSAGAMPSWDTVSWTSATTRDISYPPSPTTYYSQSLAQCVDGSSASAPSAESNVHTVVVTPPASPSQPIPSAGTLGYYSIRITWGASSGTSPITYTVRYGAGNYNSTACTNISTTTCDIGGLAAGTNYNFSVTATNSIGTSVGYTTGYTVPTINVYPSLLNGYGNVTRVDWGWAQPGFVAPPGTYFDSYANYNTALVCDNTYSYYCPNNWQNPSTGHCRAGIQVSVYSSLSVGSHHSVGSAIAQPDSTPISASFSGGTDRYKNGIRTRWVGSGPYTYFQLRYKVGHSGDGDQMASALDPANTDSWLQQGLAAGTNYRFKVWAANCYYKYGVAGTTAGGSDVKDTSTLNP